ncbi:MAG TPA: hypothetical protein VHR97_13440, partial [Candidatus Baltobacteraceae bacterium]|nr:hypothetical protein [Candidatus Baltobacteraceae bacterium]
MRLCITGGRIPFPDSSRYVLALCALAVLAACGGQYQAPLSRPVFSGVAGGLVNTTGVRPSAAGVRSSSCADAARSWMSPEAAKTALLYVADLDCNVVNVFSYPDDKPMGKLTDDLASPDGICVDAKQNVWIVNNAGAVDVAVEYKHGGKKHVAAVQDPGLGAHIGCSVDPATGNLAVTTYGLGSSGGGLVAVYVHAKGTPKHYTDSKIPHFNFCGYDPKGNLYADGTDAAQSQFFFAELSKGANAFKNITLKGGLIYYPGQVQWDGKYVAVGDQSVGQADVSAINQTTGVGGKIVHVTPIDDPTDGSAEDIVQFWIDGKTVVGPNLDGSDVGFYKYP